MASYDIALSTPGPSVEYILDDLRPDLLPSSTAVTEGLGRSIVDDPTVQVKALAVSVLRRHDRMSRNCHMF